MQTESGIELSTTAITLSLGGTLNVPVSVLDGTRQSSTRASQIFACPRFFVANDDWIVGHIARLLDDHAALLRQSRTVSHTAEIRKAIARQAWTKVPRRRGSAKPSISVAAIRFAAGVRSGSFNSPAVQKDKTPRNPNASCLGNIASAVAR